MVKRKSWASSEATRKSMLANRGRDTGPELAVRSAVHAAGLRFRVSRRPVAACRRTADMLFTRAKVAVFIDGCFWHGCPEHYVEPATNLQYWRTKFVSNTERDRDTDNRLEAAGWLVVRVWEHEPTEAAAARVVQAVATRLGPAASRETA